MDWKFWICRFLLAYGLALMVIAGGQLIRGRPMETAIDHGLLWALVSAAVYVIALGFRARRRCVVCANGD